MTELEQYLMNHEISAYELCMRAIVRYEVVICAIRGIPVSAEHARRIRQATWEATGVTYNGALPTYPDEPEAAAPALQTMKNRNASEIALLREKIALEYQASARVFTDFTETAKHEYINQRQENIAACFNELRRYMTPQDAMEVMLEFEEAVLLF